MARAVITFIVGKGHSREMGARIMRDTVESEMGNPVADRMPHTPELEHPVRLHPEADPASTGVSVGIQERAALV